MTIYDRKSYLLNSFVQYDYRQHLTTIFAKIVTKDKLHVNDKTAFFLSKDFYIFEGFVTRYSFEIGNTKTVPVEKEKKSE
jgi:hypothetical protein